MNEEKHVVHALSSSRLPLSRGVLRRVTSIFLSYARNDDEAFVRRLHTDLTAAGFDVWFDRVSMPSRQLTFHQEIRDAIAERDRLLLLVGPGVLTSDYVTQEWRFAYFEAGKCVNPIVRLDGRSVSGAVIDGYELIPDDLKLLHAEDFRDDAHYDAHLANLIRQLSEAIPPVGKLVAVPELPACFLAQPDRIKALRDLLLVDLQKPVVVSGAAARVGLQGMGGIGKSVLASALAHRPEVRRAFPDGIFWITLGQKPQLAELQRWLARELGDEALFPDERSGKECLRALLVGRKALLVLDDVWQREDAEAFNVIGAMGRILLTTRDAGLVTALASNETHYRVELPTEAEAETIFASAAQSKTDAPAMAISLAEVREIVAQCGRLPLALALCGGMVQKGVTPQAVLEALRRHALRGISTRHPEAEQHRNLWVAMEASLGVLPAEEQKRFTELAIFPLDKGAPQAAVDTLWQHTGGLEPYESQILLAELAERSLVQLSPATEGNEDVSARMTLHDLLHNFASGIAEKQFGSLAALHRTLLDAYRQKCTSGWPSGPDDGYFFQNLCEHLLAAGMLDDAVELLTDLPWIEAKCKAKLVFSLQEDYRNTIAGMPEAQKGLHLERERQARLARWSEQITNYSRQFSDRRERLEQGERGHESEPSLPESPASSRMWTEEEIGAECQRIIENPTRLDRMRAFAGFVQQECYPLAEFGATPGFLVQHAFNSAPLGPVHQAAEQALSAAEAPLLILRWFSSDRYNPKPALLRTLAGHTDSVRGLGVTPNGLRAVSRSEDKTLRVWDLETGRFLRVLDGHTKDCPSLSVTADGQLVVFATNQTLWVSELETGRCIRKLRGHAIDARGVSMTPDGLLAVSTGGDHALQVWDLRAGRCLRVLNGHTSLVFSVSVTPNGLRGVSASMDKTLRVWELETGRCLRVLGGHTDWVYSVSVTPDGLRAVSSSSDKTVRVWDLETGECLRVLEGHTATVWNVGITPDGMRAVSSSSDKTVRVWDLETGQCLRVLVGHAATVWNVSITPDCRRAVSASKDQTLRVWDLESGRCLRVRDGRRDYVSCVMPDGLRAISVSDDNTLRVWSLEAGQCLSVLEGHAGYVESVSVTPDSRRAVSASLDKTLRVWDLATGQCLQVLEGHTESVRCVSVTPDGRCAVSGSSDGTLRLWELETGRCLRIFAAYYAYPVMNVSVTPDGLRAISATEDNRLSVWDLETGKCQHTLEALDYMEDHVLKVLSTSVTLDGLRAVSASEDNRLRVWDLDTGKCLREFDGPTSISACLSMTPDSQRVVSASYENTLRVWELETGKCLQVLDGHTDLVNCVTVSADGLLAISASADNTLRVWDLETGRCQALAVLPAPARSIALSPRLGQVIAGTSTGHILQFELRGMSLTHPSEAS